MSKLINLAGQRFGFWLVQSRDTNSESGHAQWSCLCDCGSIKSITSNSLRTGNSTSCGCNHTPDLIGIKFGQLKVTGLHLSDDKSRRFWNCACKCGGHAIVSTYKLREGIVRSCGCDITDSFKKAIAISKNLSAMLIDAVIKFDEAETLILDSRKLSSITGPVIMSRGINIMKDQIKIIASLNSELQKNIDLMDFEDSRLKKN
jgi:hypothetical protein